MHNYKKTASSFDSFTLHTADFLDSVFIDNFKKADVLQLEKIWNEFPASFSISHEAIISCYYEYLANKKLYDSFKFLCSLNIDLNKKTFMGAGFLNEAVFQDNTEAAKLLIESGADINMLHHNYHDTPVFYIKSKKMSALLHKYNADFNIIDSNGDTILHSFVFKNTHTEIIKEVIENSNFNLLNYLNKNSQSILDSAILAREYNEKQLDTMIYLYQLNVPYNKEILCSSSAKSSILFQKYILGQNSKPHDIKINKYRI